MRTFTAAVVFGLLATAANAHAELVFFANGRSLSVKGHRIEDGRLVLQLRSGGEVICDPSVIVRVAPDEVPYPEPDESLPAPGENAENGQQANPSVDRRLYDPIIARVAAEQGVDVKLVRAVIQVESGYQERARSPKGAMGLMQLMPVTARQYAVSNPYDPAANIEGGIRYLKALLSRFPLRVALAAYNAGEAAVERFGGIPPYPETREYVRRVLEIVGR
jgi:hypothetical protein